MLKRMPTHCFDETCASCVVAGDFIFLAHHAGGFDRREISHQMRAVFERMKTTLNAAGATLNDLVQVNLYLQDLADFDAAIEVFHAYFEKDCFPARMTLTTDFIDAECLCMMDGVAYRPQPAPACNAGTAVAFSVADELMKFKGLLDAHIITRDEFDAQKRRLLNG